MNYQARFHQDFLESLGESVICLKKYSPEKAKKKLNLKRKIHFSLSQDLLRNIESEKALSQNENLLEDVMSSDEVVFSMEGWFIVTGESLGELNSNCQNLYERAKLCDLKVISEGRGLAHFFTHIIPGVSPSMKLGNT